MMSCSSPLIPWHTGCQPLCRPTSLTFTSIPLCPLSTTPSLLLTVALLSTHPPTHHLNIVAIALSSMACISLTCLAAGGKYRLTLTLLLNYLIFTILLTPQTAHSLPTIYCLTSKSRYLGMIKLSLTVKYHQLTLIVHASHISPYGLISSSTFHLLFIQVLSTISRSLSASPPKCWEWTYCTRIIHWFSTHLLSSSTVTTPLNCMGRLKYLLWR